MHRMGGWSSANELSRAIRTCDVHERVLEILLLPYLRHSGTVRRLDSLHDGCF